MLAALLACLLPELAFAANPEGVWVKNVSRGLAVRQGPPEGVRSCGERATAHIEDIWFEKIHGCSYRGGGTFYSTYAMPDSDQVRAAFHPQVQERDMAEIRQCCGKWDISQMERQQAAIYDKQQIADREPEKRWPVDQDV